MVRSRTEAIHRGSSLLLYDDAVASSLLRSIAIEYWDGGDLATGVDPVCGANQPRGGMPIEFVSPPSTHEKSGRVSTHDGGARSGVEPEFRNAGLLEMKAVLAIATVR